MFCVRSARRELIAFARGCPTIRASSAGVAGDACVTCGSGAACGRTTTERGVTFCGTYAPGAGGPISGEDRFCRPYAAAVFGTKTLYPVPGSLAIGASPPGRREGAVHDCHDLLT